MILKPFRQNGATVTLSGTTSSSNSAINKNASTARVVNVGAVAVGVTFGAGSGTTATLAAGVIVPGPGVATLSTGGADYVAVITASSTATVYVTPGEGT